VRWAPLLAAIFLLSVSACGGGDPQAPSNGGGLPSPEPTPDLDPVIAAAGDIACGSATPRSAPCKQMDTSELLLQIQPSAVLALGDLQYEFGEAADFARFYDVSWGRLKPITRPAPGNHDYAIRDASGYFDYFLGPGRNSSDAVGSRGEGWYSFDVGTWHIVSLNSNCAQIASGCGANSPQLRFLRADLANTKSSCTLAFWHHPRFSSGQSQGDRNLDPFWQALYEFNADVILVGHDHGYERFAPQNPAGQFDVARGMREFVVGTGGHSFEPFTGVQPNSEVRNNQTFGVLKLRLRPHAYDWLFQPIAGSSFTDSGSDVCH
jgi:hypothetical protein